MSHHPLVTNIRKVRATAILAETLFFDAERNSRMKAFGRRRQFAYEIFFLACLLGLFFLWSPGLAQTAELKTDSTVISDSTVHKTAANELQGPISYRADDVSLSDGGNTIWLRGRARLKYQDMALKAAIIRIDQQKKILYATGVSDSLDADSNRVMRGIPVFTETGQEPLFGDSIEYNFHTQRGIVKVGKTKMEPGYYRGQDIHRIADSTLLVKNGIFTSCEYIDHPHYYFKSSKIRLKVHDKVIAKPIVFYIADVPLMWLPFGIFPNKGGRHSGIVIPKYGESTVGGRFLRGMGYYWAPNDYFDATFLTDYYDKLGFAYRTRARYTVRYKLNGSFNAEYYPRNPSSGERAERWRFSFTHRQKIDPTMNISGSGSFMSDRQFARQLSPNLEDRLNQNITSSLSFNKSWPGTGNSLTLSTSRNENLQTGRVSYTLPNLSFNHSSRSLYETLTGKKLGGKRNWLQSINYSYSSRLINRGDKVTQNDSTISQSQSRGIQHNISLNAPNKFLKYITVNPRLNIQEDWVDEITLAQYDSVTKTIVERQKKQFAARHSFTTSISARTKLYGLFEPNIGSLKYIRHLIEPSVSFNFRPDLSGAFYGYFNEIADSNGVIRKVDKFKKSPFGGTGRSESKSMSLRLSNVFEGKKIDENGKEKKISLLTATFNTNYDFTKDSLRWSDLSTSLRTRLFGKNISISMRHSFYKLKKDKSGRLNQFLPFPELLNLSTSFGFSITDRTFSKKKAKGENTKTTHTDSLQAGEGILKEETSWVPHKDYKKETSQIKLPWSTSFTFNYSYNRLRKDPNRLDMTVRASFQLSENWKVSWNAYFDLVDKKITTQRFTFYRNLHCWEMSFGWQPAINYYDFQINIKASALHDIKLTKHPIRNYRLQ